MKDKLCYLVVSWMSKLAITMGTSEPGLVGVGHQVIVEAVLTGEGCSAQAALKWPQPSVAPGNSKLNEMIFFMKCSQTCNELKECCKQ